MDRYFYGKISKMKEAKECKNIEEIRAGIDEIDQQIIAAFGKRMEYVSEIVKFKTDEEGIVAHDRQLEVLRKIREIAHYLNLDPDLYEELYRTLINWNIQKELELFNNKEKANI